MHGLRRLAVIAAISISTVAVPATAQAATTHPKAAVVKTVKGHGLNWDKVRFGGLSWDKTRLGAK